MDIMDNMTGSIRYDHDHEGKDIEYDEGQDYNITICLQDETGLSQHKLLGSKISPE